MPATRHVGAGHGRESRPLQVPPCAVGGMAPSYMFFCRCWIERCIDGNACKRDAGCEVLRTAAELAHPPP